MKFKINEDLKLIREMLELSQEEISLFIDVDKKTITISYQNVGNNTALLTDFDATMIKYTRSISGMTSGVL